jgi:hypothetical protein
MFCFRNGNKMQCLQTCRICNNKKQILQHSQAFKYTNICDILNAASLVSPEGKKGGDAWPTLDILRLRLHLSKMAALDDLPKSLRRNEG